MIEIQSIENPRFANKTGTLIDMDVTTDQFGKCPCTFHIDDDVAYKYKGKVVTNGGIFEMAVKGDFGAIKPFP